MSPAGSSDNDSARLRTGGRGASSDNDSARLRTGGRGVSASLPTVQVSPSDFEPLLTIRPEGGDEQSAPASSAGLGYALGPEIGRGGMAAVNAAEQLSFGRTVAVKRLLPSIGDRRASAWFHAEAVATALLEHPNIVPVYDLTTLPDGHLQLAMKKVDGVTWRQVLHPDSKALEERAKGYDLDAHLDILLKVCDAIAFAHDRGILHRDLKPENIMIGAYGEVLVMDWGLAVAYGAHRLPALIPRVETATVVAGTPAYMAPEQARCEPGRMGPHTDVYLLGAILYEVLTGSAPHRGKNVKAVIQAASKGEVQPPRERTTARIRDELSDIVMAALAAEPASRTASVAAFAGALRAYRKHAEAVRLAHAGRALFDAAQDPACADADVRYQRALAAVEQALELWPDYRNGRKLLVQVLIAAARHALASGALRLARRQAQEAADHARHIGHQQLEATAQDLAEEARGAVLAETAHQRNQRVLKPILAGVALLVIVVLGIAVLWIAAEQRKRQSVSVAAAPEFIAKATALMPRFEWDAALEAAELATTLDPRRSEAWVLMGRLQLGKLRFAEARQSLLTAVARDSEREAALAPLIALCERYERLAAPGGELAPEQQFGLAEDMRRGDDPLVAGYLLRASGEGMRLVLEAARQQLQQANPASRDLGFTYTIEGDAVGLRISGREIEDLEALADLPLTRLDLDGTRVENLTALIRMPLRQLSLAGTRVQDLGPLRGMKLTWLNLGGLQVRDLSPLAGMPLETLDLADTPVSDCSPLVGAPLRSLVLSGSAVDDLRPLARMPLRHLHLRFIPARDFSPLARLREIDASCPWVAYLAGATSHEEWAARRPAGAIDDAWRGLLCYTAMRLDAEGQRAQADETWQEVAQATDEALAVPAMRLLEERAGKAR